MAVLLGFRVLGRGRERKRNRVVRECGCRRDKGGCIKTAEKAHTLNFTLSVLQRPGYVASQLQKYDTEFVLLLKLVGEEVTVYRLHEVASTS